MTHHYPNKSLLLALIVMAVVGQTISTEANNVFGSNDSPTAATAVSAASSTPAPDVVATDEDYASSIGIRSFTVAVTSASDNHRPVTISTTPVSTTTNATSNINPGDEITDETKTLNFENESGTPPPLNELTANGAVARDQNGRFRIKIAEIITDEFDNGLGGEGTLDDEEDVKRRMAFRQSNAYNGGKIKLADLFPSKLEDFGPIIKQSNERLITDKHMFVQENDQLEEEMRGHVVLNEPVLDDFRSDMPSTKIEIELIDENDERPSPGISDFTKELLRESDSIISSIERNYINAPRSNIIAGEAEFIPSATINKQIDRSGFIDRRVKKMDPAAFQLPHDHVKPKPEDETHSSVEKPEFSTTKFYNSKELYSELLHKKIEDFLPQTNDGVATTNSPIPVEGTTAGSQLETSVIKSQININTPKSPKFKKLTKKVLALGKMSSLNSKGKSVSIKLTTNGPSLATTTPSTTSIGSLQQTTNVVSEELDTTKERPPTTFASTATPSTKQTTMHEYVVSTSTSTTLRATTYIPSAPNTDSETVPNAKTTKQQHLSSTEPTIPSSTTNTPTTKPTTTTTMQTSTPDDSTAAPAGPIVVVHSLHQLSRLQEKINSLECEMPSDLVEATVWRGNETHELALPNTVSPLLSIIFEIYKERHHHAHIYIVFNQSQRIIALRKGCFAF